MFPSNSMRPFKENVNEEKKLLVNDDFTPKNHLYFEGFHLKKKLLVDGY